MSTNNYLNNKKFFKPNYSEALGYLFPNFHTQDDIDNFGFEDSIESKVVKCHINFCENVSSILPITPISGTSLSSLNTFEGICQYFIKQNNLTNITTEFFSRKILKPLGVSLQNFQTKEEFKEYLDTDLLPSITLNFPTEFTHKYLIENLSWVYFLNTSASVYSPSAIVSDLISENIYYGYGISLEDSLQCLSEFFVKNNLDSCIPPDINQISNIESKIENYKTLISIVYSDLYSDRQNTRVKELFNDYIDANLLPNAKSPAGPFSRFIEAISYTAYDIDDKTNILNYAYSIDDCPPQYLPFLAESIGWKLFGTNSDRWRLQLKNAVSIYKSTGTKKSIRFALNSVFPKDSFSIDSNITELWESYIPYLLLYSIITDSTYFKETNNWTRQLANSMGIQAYSNTSFEENAKLIVDKIILDCYNKFRSSFNIPNISNKFNYRGRDYVIPPFEEYSYYANIELTEEMILYLADRLVCFGVSNEFSLQFSEYVKSNTLNEENLIKTNSWLFFTLEYNEPPNSTFIISDLSNSKIEYISLWSGKSSHFRVTFNSESFDFNIDDDLSVSSGDAVEVASKIINEFAPAHAIPLISIDASSNDSMLSFEESRQFKESYINDNAGSIRGFSNQQSHSKVINIFSTVNPSGNIVSRDYLNSLQNPLVKNSSNSSLLTTKDFVRRNYENTIPRHGYYDRTGFNMPINLSMDPTVSGFPLGFIPESNAFQDITDYSSIPEIYSECLNLNSSSFINGYYVSSTLPTRGMLDFALTRGDLPGIYQAIHYVGEGAKLQQAEYEISKFDVSNTYENLPLSLANDRTNNILSSFPASTDDYYNFQFGKDFITYYKIYTSIFSRHGLYTNLFYLNGPNIFSHTLGSLLRNSDLSLIQDPTLLTTSANNVVELNIASDKFTLSSGVYTLSSVLPSIELCHYQNSFNNTFRVIQRNKDRFIELKSKDGLSTIKLDISKFDNPISEGHPILKNFLIPDNKYKFEISALSISNDMLKYGETNLGVWIHTNPEGGNMWSYVNGQWVYHSSTLTIEEIKALFNTLSFRKYEKSINETSDLRCLVTLNSPSSTISNSINLEEFEPLSIQFDTNTNFLVDTKYFNTYGNPHRLDQQYVIEVFAVANSIKDNSVFIRSFNLYSLTLNRLSKILVTGDNFHNPLRQMYCPEFRVPMTKEHIRNVFIYWNFLADSVATRVFDPDITLLEHHRLSHRLIPQAYTSETYTGSEYIQKLDTFI